MGPLVFDWPSPLLVFLAYLSENFVGSTFYRSHAYPPASFSQGPVLSYGPSSLIRSPFSGNFFFVCGLLEPKQLSPTDEISALGFELAPFFLGKRVLLTDFTVRKQGEC